MTLFATLTIFAAAIAFLGWACCGAGRKHDGAIEHFREGGPK